MLRRHLAGGVIAVAVCLSSTGCGSQGGPPGEDHGPSSAPSTPAAEAGDVPSATPEPSPPALPEPVNTRAARKAFAEHVLDAWSYAIATNDAEPLLALSPAGTPCEGCSQLQAELRRRTTQGWYVDFPGAQVRSVRVTDTSGTSLARMGISIPASHAFNDDGSFRSSSPAHHTAGFEVSMRFVRGGYRLLSFTVTT